MGGPIFKFKEAFVNKNVMGIIVVTNDLKVFKRANMPGYVNIFTNR